MTSLLGCALAAARRGWRVFPVVPGGKRPAVKAWEARATIDEDRIRRCWGYRDYNIGIATGPSDLVVIDLDMPKQVTLDGQPGGATGADNLTDLAAEHGRVVPAGTFTVTTASGGMHLYFTHPAGPSLRNTAGKLAALVDTRAHGGYVVAPGSRITGGGVYTAHPADIAPLPEWLAALLRPRPLPATPTGPVRLTGNHRASAYVTAAITRQVETIRDAARAGDGRKRALYYSAVALGQLVAGGAVAENEITQILTAEAHQAGLFLGESARSIQSGLTAGARRPRRITA